jgi:acetyl-CoA acyltransferase
MDAYIITGYRSAVGKAGRGGFSTYRSDDLAVDIIRHLMAKVPQLEPSAVDDVIVGCANPEGEQGLQVGRQIALRALGQDVPGMTINRYCASGLEAIAIATAKIRAGMGHCYIAGGAESMSMIPMTGYKFAPSYAVASTTPDYLASMGATAEAVADRYGISREAADMFALRSHTLAAKAQDSGRFADEIVPIAVPQVLFKAGKKVVSTLTVAADEGIRRDTSLEALGALKPVFREGGVVTAGNASQTSDGAAFVLVMSKQMMRDLELSPEARLVACSVAGVDPLYMGIGPCAAIPKALRQGGLALADIGITELNEAFATQALAVIKVAGLDPETVNVNGGAIALGHPLGCTGAKLSIQLINELKRREQRYGLVTACVGGGQGIAGIFEKL